MVVIKTKTRRMIPGATPKNNTILSPKSNSAMPKKTPQKNTDACSESVTISSWSRSTVADSQKKPKASVPQVRPHLCDVQIGHQKLQCRKGITALVTEEQRNKETHHGVGNTLNSKSCMYIDIQTIIYGIYIFINIDKQHLPKGAIFFGSIWYPWTGRSRYRYTVQVPLKEYPCPGDV